MDDKTPGCVLAQATQGRSIPRSTCSGMDRTTGGIGGLANVSGNGGTTAFSAAVETAAITVLPVDATPPTAQIVEVTPDPRNTQAGTVTINFSEAVTEVNVAEFLLDAKRRDGGSRRLDGRGFGLDLTRSA